jgi:hypothetical protein
MNGQTESMVKKHGNREVFPIWNKIRKVLLVLGIGISITLLGNQLYQSIVTLKSGEVELFNYWALAAAAFCMLVGILQQINAWYLLMRGLKIKLPFHDSRVGYALSFLARYIPGSVWGYLGRGEWLYQKYGISFVDASVSSILEILLSVLACILIIGISRIVFERKIIFVYALAVIIPLLSWILFQNPYSKKKFDEILKRFRKGYTYPAIPFKAWMAVLILLSTNWFYFGLSLGLCGVAFGEWNFFYTVDNLLLFTGDFAIAWIMGFLAFFLPSGLGLRELLIGELISNQIGVSPQIANAISIAMRLVASMGEIFSVVLLALTNYLWIQIKKVGRE